MSTTTKNPFAPVESALLDPEAFWHDTFEFVTAAPGRDQAAHESSAPPANVLVAAAAFVPDGFVFTVPDPVFAPVEPSGFAPPIGAGGGFSGASVGGSVQGTGGIPAPAEASPVGSPYAADVVPHDVPAASPTAMPHSDLLFS